MLVGEFETENISRQIKSADLASSVAEDFVSTDTAADYLVKIVCRLVLAKYFGVVRIGHRRAHQVHRLAERVGVDSVAARGVQGTARGHAADFIHVG